MTAAALFIFVTGGLMEIAQAAAEFLDQKIDKDTDLAGQMATFRINGIDPAIVKRVVILENSDKAAFA